MEARKASIMPLLKNLYDAVKIIKKEETPGLTETSYEIHVVAVDFVKSQMQLMVYQHGDYERELFDDGSSPETKYTRTDITRRKSIVYDYITTKLASSPDATDMCAGINPEYTTEQIEDVELGFFVFGMAERKAKQTEKLFKEFHGFVTCRVNRNRDTLKIDLICASLKGLGTQLMKTIFGYATLNNYQRIKLYAATDLLACFYYPRFEFKLLKPEDKFDPNLCKQRTVLRSDTGTRVLVRKLEDKMYPMVLELKTYNSKLRSARKAEEAEEEEAGGGASPAAEEAGGEAPPAAETTEEKAENVMAYYQNKVDVAREAARKAAEAEATAEATTEAAAKIPEGVLLGYAIKDFEEQSKIIKFRKAIEAIKARKDGTPIEQAAEQAAVEANLSEELTASFLAAAAAAEAAPAEAAAAAEAAAEAAAAAAEAAAAAAEKGPKRGNGRTRKRKRSLKKNKKSRKNKTKTLKRKVGRNTSKKRKNNVH